MKGEDINQIETINTLKYFHVYFYIYIINDKIYGKSIILTNLFT